MPEKQLYEYRQGWRRATEYPDPCRDEPRCQVSIRQGRFHWIRIVAMGFEHPGDERTQGWVLDLQGGLAISDHAVE